MRTKNSFLVRYTCIQGFRKSVDLTIKTLSWLCTEATRANRHANKYLSCSVHLYSRFPKIRRSHDQNTFLVVCWGYSCDSLSWDWLTKQGRKIKASHSCLLVTRVRSTGKTKGRVSKHKVEISKRVSWIAVVDHSSSIESRLILLIL